MTFSKVAVFAAVLLSSLSRVDGGATCIRCHEDFNVFANRRGYGGGRYFWLDPAATAATEIGFFNNPSTGWRTVNEASVLNGNGNYWIGAWSPTTSNIHQRQPELLSRNRRQTTGTADAGTFVIRASKTTTTPTATGMCAGAYAGGYILAEKWGLVNDFSQFSMSAASWNPGSLSSGVGLVFNARHTFSGYSGYTAIVRNAKSTSTPFEVCAGIYKTVNGANVALTNQVFTDSARIPDFVNTLNPTLLTTPLSSRTFQRMGVSKSGGTISLWFNTPSNIVLTVVDPSPLPAGAVGVAGIAANAAVFDDVVLHDSPRCNDGLWNGQETGVDCGGASGDAICPACSTTESYSHNFGTDALTGWHGEIFGTGSNAHYPRYTATSISWSTNTGLTWPGSSGKNCRGWFNGWFYIADKWAPMMDGEITWDVTPVDNDWLGMVWRWQDHNNYYHFITRQENQADETPFAIQRRRNGINTNVWVQDAQFPDPYTPAAKCTFRVVITGSTFSVYNGAVLIATVTDPDPILTPGFVGFMGGNQQGIIAWAFTYTIYRNPSPAAIQPPSLSLSASGINALTVHVSGASVPVYSIGSLPVWRGLSSFGQDFTHSPLILPASSQPGVVSTISSAANAVVFAGAQFLLADTLTLGEPAFLGMTLVMTIAPTATVATGFSGVVIGKGLRDRPYNTYASGWRLDLTTDRAISGFPAGTLALQFSAQGADSTADRTINVATPVTINAPVVIAIRIVPTSSSTTPLSSRTFSVEALINNVSFVDTLDTSLIGIISSSSESYLAIGATDVLTDGANVAILETQLFSTSVSDADFVASINYQMGLYVGIGAATCSPLSVPNAVPVSGDCGGSGSAASGASCVFSCDANTTQTAGTPGAPMTCRGGQWVGVLPRCEFICPTLTAVGTGTAGCRSAVFVETWSGGNGLVGMFNGVSTYRNWAVAPSNGGHIAVNAARSVTISPPFGFRIGSLTTLTVNAPTWGSSTARLAVTQSATIPSRITGQQLLVTLLPRFVDAVHYYSIEIQVSSDPTVGNRTIVRRQRGLTSTTLCTIDATTLRIVPGTAYTFETTFGALVSGVSSVTMRRDGSTFCQFGEVTATFITAGTAGYAVSGSPGFTPVTFGPMMIENAPTSCLTGCSGVVAGGNCTLPCNPGTIARGSNVRTCLDGSWNYSGTPLVCDNGAPLLADATAFIPELSSIGTKVGIAQPPVFANGRKGDGSIVFEITAGNANKAFSIDSCSGQILVASPSLLDFEVITANSADLYALTLRAYVPGTSPVAEAFAAFTITVTNANDPPIIVTTTCTIAENSAAGAPVCSLVITDADALVNPVATFSFVFEESAGLFNLNKNTGAITVGLSNSLNFEAKNTYQVVVRASDPIDASISSTQAIAITVTDQAEAPIINDATSFVSIYQSSMVSGFVLATANIINDAVIDQDAGTSLTITSSSAITSPMLVVIGTSGDVQVASTQSYTGVSPTLKDGRLIVGYGEMQYTVRDNTMLSSVGTLRIYVLANVTGVLGPIVRGMSVLAADSTSGSMNVQGATTGGPLVLLNTNGLDQVSFTGDNFLYSADHSIQAIALSSNGLLNFTVNCAYAYTGAMSGSSPLADAILCPTEVGYGSLWSWSLDIRVISTSTPVTVVPSIALVSSYAPPSISAIGPPGPPGTTGNFPTAGNTPIQITGYNLGSPTAPVTVRLGAVDPVTSLITWLYTAASVTANHNTLSARTPEGNGAGLVVSVTVGDQTTVAPLSVRFAYNAPTITAITRVTLTAWPYGIVPTRYSGSRGGDTIYVTGANLGPAGTPVVLTFGLPAWADAQLPYSVVCTHSNVTLAHTRVQCVLPQANGGRHTAFIAVGNQQSLRTTTIYLTYSSIYVSALTGPGARAADTRGGQVIYFNGFNFGTQAVYNSGLCPAPMVYYGRHNGNNYTGLQYTMTDCMITDVAGSTIGCKMAEGTGFSSGGVGWTWTVIACGTGWAANSTAVRYAPPVISSFELDPLTSPGAVDADTRGNQAVVLYGQNFGPSMLYVTATYLAAVTGPDGVTRNIRFNATGCFKPVNDERKLPHQMMTCFTSAGAGAGMKWEIIVETQRSVQLTTKYAISSISAISSAAPPAAVSPMTAASDLGGGIVYIIGSQFGPLLAADTGRSLVQKVKFGPVGASDESEWYHPTTFSHIVDHTTIQLLLPPGIGKNLVFQITVADVDSSVSIVGAGSISYISPSVTSLSLVGSPTTGGAVAQVSVMGVGLLDASADQQLLVNGNAVTIVDRFPTRERVLSALNVNGTSLTTDELDVSKHYLAFRIPEGAGTGVTVQVSAYRSARPFDVILSDIAADVAANPTGIILSYQAPVINIVAADRVDSGNLANMTESLFPSLTPAQADAMRYVTIIGTNLGPSAAVSNLELTPVDVSGLPTGTWGSVGSYVATITSWTHTRITAYVRLTQAAVRLSVPPANAAYGSLVTSNVLSFFDVSPSVLGLSGNIPMFGFNTAGGESVIVQSRALASYSSLQVFIGDARAYFLDTDGVTIIPDNDVRTQVTDPQYLTQLGAGVAAENMIFELRVRVPEGQGSGVSIFVVRDGVNGTSVDVTIDYAMPTIAQVGYPTAPSYTNMFAPVSQISSSSPVRVFTQGADIIIQGSNFGVCPVVLFGLARGGLCPEDQYPGDGVVIVFANHTEIIATIPAGAGNGSSFRPAGMFLQVGAGNQVSNSLSAAYALPTIATITSTSVNRFPTSGENVVLAISGSGFGPMSAPVPEVNIYLNSIDYVSCSNVARNSSAPHTSMSCVLPAGSGQNLMVEILVAEQRNVFYSLSYNTPTIYSMTTRSSGSNSIVSTSAFGNAAFGPTVGGYEVEIVGTDFGARDSSTGCIFLPYSTVPATSLLCNEVADSWNEQEVPSFAINFWNDTFISFTMPAGMGARTVRIVARNQISVNATANSDVFRYNAPNVTSMTPLVSNTNGELITLTGSDFGFGPTQAFNDARTKANWAPVSLSSVALMDATGPAYAQPFALRINFFDATHCISSAVVDDGAIASRVDTFPACYNEASGYAVLIHTHDKLVFKGLPGVGRNHNISLSIIAPDGSEVISAPLRFSYASPTVTSVNPTMIRMDAATIISPPTSVFTGLYSFNSFATPLVIRGVNFGPSRNYSIASAALDPANELNWSPFERVVSITVGSHTCPDASRKQVNNGVVLECKFLSDTAVGVPLNSPYVPRVGFPLIKVQVAGQLSDPAAYDVLHLVCAKETYGLPGEICLPCPTGAICDGYKGRATIDFSDLTANYVNITTSEGLDVVECMYCHSAPRAKAGFFNMKGKTDEKGATDSVCEPVRQAEGLRAAKDCDFIVACDPPEACLADNICASGYTSTKWPYRCSQCEDGFYRSAGNCRACPNNPALNILFFFVVAVFAIGFGWILNQKGINIAFLTIGLDYMQVISIFASTRVAWPQQIKDLFRILSAFNLNIEIIAPECAFKGITYGQKWGMIMALPVAVFALLFVMHTFVVTYYVFIKGQSKSKIGAMASPLIAMAQVLMYFLFLYITRSVFDVMTCRGMDPPEYDSDGKEITYMIGIFERCGIAGGTQLSLIGGAVAALVVYVLGYPALIAYNLWKNRDLVMEDQLLRAKRVGNDKLTNPNAFEFRRRYSRTYYQFRPDMFLWVLVILLRKFLIAVSSLVFNTNQNFQMAAMLLVLFLAYAAQVRYAPYMGPSTFDDVLKAHTEAARQGDGAHLRLAATLSGIQTRGRRRTQARSLFQAGGRISPGTAVTSIARWFFDYNSVEAILVASALLVALAGVMFGATTASSTGSNFYAASRDGVMAAILVVIALSIIYWLVVVIGELVTLYNEDQATKSLLSKRTESAKGAAGMKARKGSVTRLTGEEETAADVNMSPIQGGGPVENENNPMFFVSTSNAENDANNDKLGLDLDAVRSMQAIPSPTVWTWIQMGYLETNDQVTALEEEKNRLLAQLNGASMMSSSMPSKSGGGKSSPPSSKNENSRVTKSGDDAEDDTTEDGGVTFGTKSPLQKNAGKNRTSTSSLGSSSSRMNRSSSKEEMKKLQQG